MTTTLTPTQVVDMLNDYDANHSYSSTKMGEANEIWPDLIQGLPGYDDEASELVAGCSMDEFVADGQHYVHDHQSDQWRHVGPYVPDSE